MIDGERLAHCESGSSPRQAACFRYSPSLAQVSQPTRRLLRPHPHQPVIGFTAPAAPDEFGGKENAPLAVILTLRGGEDELIRRPQRPSEFDVQATFFGRLSDSRLRGRLAAGLTAARQEEALRRRDEGDFAPRISDDDVTAGAQDVIGAREFLAKLWDAFNQG
jgi:hypothetical protein